MKKRLVFVLMVMALFVGSNALAAQDEDCNCEETACNCEKGGLGLKIENFVCAFGFKTFSSKLGCDKNVGIGFGIGSELNRFTVGFGFNEGVLGFGFGFKGPETTNTIGFSLGYDYGDCRLIWPVGE